MIKKIYNWIKKQIGWFVIGGVAMAGTVSLLPEQQSDLITLENTIDIDRQDNGKYKRQDKKIIDGVEYKVHEYSTSKYIPNDVNTINEIGYTIFITKEEDKKIYQKAIATGVQKEDREFDWRLVQDNTPIIIDEVATSTIK